MEQAEPVYCTTSRGMLGAWDGRDGRESERLSILQVDCWWELRHLMEKSEATNHRAPKAKLRVSSPGFFLGAGRGPGDDAGALFGSLD